MKRPSSGLGVGLWVVGGIVAGYLLGGVAIYIDAVCGSSAVNSMPEPLSYALAVIYNPTFNWLLATGILTP